jgi:chromosomal replication initiation ATPase DnaA
MKKQTLQKVPEKVAMVEKIISDTSLVSIKDMRGHMRLPEYVDARMAVWYVLHTKLNMGYSVIGRIYNRDHSSIVYGVQKASNSSIGLHEWMRNGIYDKLEMWDFL